MIQKLHSAVQTYAYDGPRRGMVGTTGRFTGPAEEYAERVSADPDDLPEPTASLTFDPVYLPRAASTTALGEYEYDHAFAANGDDRVTLVDEFGECVHYGPESGGDGDASGPITYCENCGSLSCEDHIREKRPMGDPVCTGCSVTVEFFLATKHFYDEGNREAFAAEYAAMPVYRKPLENPRLAAALVGGALLVLAALLVAAL